MVNEIKRDTVDYRDPTPFDNTKLNSLSEISKALRHKTYGEDTREAIAQQGEALAKLMQETGGNQSAEVLAARGKFELLGIREDAQDNAIGITNENLASKADKDYIDNYLSQVSYMPETVASLDELKAKYPSGKPGLFVTADTGHKYIWTNSAWKDAGVYNTQGITEDGVTYHLRTRQGESGVLLANQNIEFEVDTKLKTIRYNMGVGVLNGARMTLIASSTGEDITLIDSGYILFNVKASKIYMAPFTNPSNTTERENSIKVGQISYDGGVTLNTTFDYTVDGVKVKHKVTRDDLYTARTGNITWSHSYHADLITDEEEWRLELPLSLIATGIRPIFNIPPTGSNEGTITSYSMTDITKIGGYIVYNQTSGDIYGVGTKSSFKPDDVTIGQAWGNGRYTLYGGGACFLNGVAQMARESHSIPAEVVSAAAQPALVNSDGILSIDLNAKTIGFENATNVDLTVGKTRLYYGSLKFDGSELVTDDPQTIVIDLADNTIKAVKRNSPQPDSCATIVRLWNWDLGQYYAANSNLLIKVNGQIINNAAQYGFNSESLAIGGDSTVAGFIGQTDSEHHIHTKFPVDHWINLRLGLKTDNIGVDGATIYGSGEKSLAKINEGINWTNYTKYALQIGVNDYQGNVAPLADVIATLKKQLELIFNANPNIKIYAALPLHSFRKPGWVEGEALNEPNAFGDTLNDYMDALKAAYKEHDISVLDWRDSPIITKTGYASQTVDLLHPNDHTYMVMGQRWASFIEYLR